MTRYTITFVYNHAIVSTDIEGNDSLVERASAKIQQEIGASTTTANEVIIHEHRDKKGPPNGLL